MQYDLSPSEYPLLETYKLFEANEILDRNFENPNNDKDFELSVYWYLELIGFHTIKLEKGEIIRENKINKGSADILFYDNESKTMFAVDCTIGVPAADKIDKIRNTSNYISECYKFPVKPIIFTPKICTAVKSNAKENEVNIIDKEDIIILKQYFKNGYSYLPRARRFITKG